MFANTGSSYGGRRSCEWPVVPQKPPQEEEPPLFDFGGEESPAQRGETQAALPAAAAAAAAAARRTRRATRTTSATTKTTRFDSFCGRGMNVPFS